MENIHEHRIIYEKPYVLIRVFSFFNFFPWQQRRKLCQITEQTYISNCGRCHSDFVFYVSEYLWYVRPTAAFEVC